MEKLKVALIGSGQVAQTAHIPNYQSLAGVEVVAVCDTNLEAAKAVAEKFGITAYFNDHLELLEQVKPDAVSICVPNKFHCQLTCDALEHGVHVYCEKPPAITVAEAKQMEAAAKRNNRLLTYGFHFRHSSNVNFLKKKIGQGDFGDIYAAKAQWIRRRGIPGWGNFTNNDIQGGGPLIDIGAHMLDLAVYLLDYPKIRYVSAAAYDMIGKQGGIGLMGAWDKDKFTVEDSLFGFIQFENGTSLQLETAFALHTKERDTRNVQLFGTHLGASVFPLATYGEECDTLTDTAYPFLELGDNHQKAITNFVDVCRGEANLLVTAKQAVYVQELICGLYQSAKDKQPIIF